MKKICLLLALCIAVSMTFTACSEKFFSTDEDDYYEYLEKVAGAADFMPSLSAVGEYSSFTATYKHSRTALMYELDTVGLFLSYEDEEAFLDAVEDLSYEHLFYEKHPDEQKTDFEAEVNGIRKEGDNETLTCHVCYVALEPDKDIHPFWHRERYLFSNAVNYRDQVKFDETQPDYIREFSADGVSDMMRIGRENGFFVTYNHPTWSVEDYRHYMGYRGMHAFEMFNGSCNASGYEDFNPRVYDDILRGGNRIYCIGADDNHNFHAEDTPRFDSGWAWTVIKADSLDYRTITKALEDGSFYASEGPEIYELSYENGMVHIKCSDAYRINLNTDIRHANTVIADEGESVNEATFGIPQQSKYFRLTVVDKNGKHACTNAYFLDELN